MRATIRTVTSIRNVHANTRLSASFSFSCTENVKGKGWCVGSVGTELAAIAALARRSKTTLMSAFIGLAPVVRDSAASYHYLSSVLLLVTNFLIRL